MCAHTCRHVEKEGRRLDGWPGGKKLGAVTACRRQGGWEAGGEKERAGEPTFVFPSVCPKRSKPFLSPVGGIREGEAIVLTSVMQLRLSSSHQNGTHCQQQQGEHQVLVLFLPPVLPLPDPLLTTVPKLPASPLLWEAASKVASAPGGKICCCCLFLLLFFLLLLLFFAAAVVAIAAAAVATAVVVVAVVAVSLVIIFHC